MRAVLLLCVCLSANAEPTYTDNWGGKKAHIDYSMLMGAVAAAADLKPAVGIGTCFGVGVLKEIADYYKPSPGYAHGLFSRRDLIADAVGCVAGYGAVTGVKWLIEPLRGGASVRLALRW